MLSAYLNCQFVSSNYLIIQIMEIQENWSDPELPETSPLPSQIATVHNLHELFNRPEYEHCLSGQNTSQITLILQHNPKVHHQILDCMLCFPNQELEQHLKEKCSEDEISNMPYKCFQLLTNLNEEYAHSLFTVSDKTQEQLSEANSILKHYFSVFQNQNTNETAAGYVLRVSQMVLMKQSSFPLYEWLNTNQEILQNLFQHFDSLSAVGIINRALDLDAQKVTTDEKVKMVEKVFERVTELALKLKHPQLLDGLKFFVDEQLQRAMNADNVEELSVQIVSIANLNRLKPLLKTDPEATVHILQILASILNHYKKQQPKQQNSNSRNFMGYRSPPDLVLAPEILKDITQTLKGTFNYAYQQETQNKSNYINQVFFKYLQALDLVAEYHTEQLKQIVTIDMVNGIVERMAKYKRNNLFHNYAKSTLVGAIKVIDKEQLIYHPQCKLVDFVFRQFDSTEHEFHQHLFQIMKNLLLDPGFQSRCSAFTKIPIDQIRPHYQQMLSQQHKLHMEDPRTNDSIDNELLDFDPTANDNQQPYQQMVIDDNYEQQGQKRASYNNWVQGIIKGGILDKDIDLQMNDEILVSSPVVHREERDKLWGELKATSSLLDSQSEENVYMKKLSNRQKGADVEKKEQVLNDEKQQENMKMAQEQKKVREEEPLKEEHPKQVAKAQVLAQETESKVGGEGRSILSAVFRPVVWIMELLWNIAD